jgi:hypothetical protein
MMEPPVTRRRINVAISITAATSVDGPNIWFLCRIWKGSTVEVFAMAAEGDMPPEVAQCHPVVVAVAPRSVWELLVEDEEEFYRRVSDAKVHVSGNYRIFGRYSLSFLRAIRETKLWEHLDEMIVGL